MSHGEHIQARPDLPPGKNWAMRPTRVRYAVLAVACSMAVITYLHRVGFASALPKLALTPVQNGWLMAAFMVAYGLFEMPSGLVGDRLGARHLIAVLVVGWSLLTGCVALAAFLPAGAAAFAFLLAVRFLFGVFQAGAFPSLSRMLTDWMPQRERASAQGTIWMASRIGGLVAPLVFGALLTLCAGSWEWPLVILAGVGVAWAAAFWPWFRNRPEEMPGVNAAERDLILAGRPAVRVAHGAVPWGAMLRSRSVWALCLMYGCGGFAANFYVTLLPSFLEKQRGLPTTTAKWIAGLPFACGMVACVGGGLFSDWFIRRTGNRRWGRRVCGLVGTTCAGLGWLLLPWVHEPLPLGVLVCAIFFFNDLNMGPAWASAADIAERYAGTLGGAMNMTAALFGAAGNLTAGYLFETGGEQVLFSVYAVSVWMSALSVLAMDVTRPLTGEGPVPGGRTTAG
jgi:MFS family permease